MKKRKLLSYIFLAVLLLLCIGSVILYVITDPYEYSKNRPHNPGDDHPYQLDTNQIDPATILSDLRSGNKDVFNPSDFNSLEDGSKEDIYPSGTFKWSQEDYLTIAKARHLYLTGEAFEDGWSFFSSGRFYIEQCRNPMRGFDYANIIFYKKNPDGSFPVTYMEIDPLSDSINSTYLTYDPRWADNGFSEADVMQGTITADDALRIAEDAGGEEMRQKLSNDGCKVSVNYYSDEYWLVSYSWATDGLRFFLYYEINSTDGSYTVSQK